MFDRGLEIVDEFELTLSDGFVVRVTDETDSILKLPSSELANVQINQFARASGLRRERIPKHSRFVGYDSTRVDEARVVALFGDSGRVNSLKSGDGGEVILD